MAKDFVEFKTDMAIAQVAVGQDIYVLDTQRNIFKYQGDGQLLLRRGDGHTKAAL